MKMDEQSNHVKGRWLIFLYYRITVPLKNIFVLYPLVDPLLKISVIFGKILADQNLFFILTQYLCG
jgi:hypothetical protein